MNYYPVLFCLFFLVFGDTLLAQSREDFFNLVEEVHSIATEAERNKDPEAYLRAAKLLRKNPTLRPLFLPEPGEKDYFSPRTLLKLALPLCESKQQRQRILKEQQRLSKVEDDHKLMNIPDGQMRVPGASNIFITSKESKSRSFQLKANLELEIRFKEGEKIGIEIFDISSNEEELIVKKDKSEKREKIIRFEAQANRRYRVVMNNDFPNADDFTLAIIVVE